MNLLNPIFLFEPLSNLISFGHFAQTTAPPSPTWSWNMLIPVILGAVGYLLIQYGIVKSKAAIAVGAAACLLAVIYSMGFVPVRFEAYVLMAFCALATGGGISFLVAREPVYAALGFASAVLSTCGVLFMQSALFIAAATMIVYAGATIIIFLFVLMFAQQSELRNYDVQLTNPLLASAIGAVLLGTIILCVTGENAISFVKTDETRPYSSAKMPSLSSGSASISSVASTSADTTNIPGATAGLGRSLYTDYLISVELAGTVLLVATIGAIALAQRTTEKLA